jgi:lipoprotein-anchoring transpeptidase ErfK/SrfK
VNAETQSKPRKRWKLPVTLGAAGVVVAGAGWFGLQKSGAIGSDAFVPAPVTAAAPAKVSIADGAANIRPDTPLILTAPSGETIGSVTVADSSAHAVTGKISPDGRTWTSLGPLRVGDTYEVTAETGDAGHNGVNLQHETFSTAQEPNSVHYTNVYPADGSRDGVAQPVVIEFAQPVTDRAAVERALSVTSDPPQAGSWGWLSSERVDFRPQSFWKPGTKIDVQVAMDGVDIGGGQFATEDRKVDFTIGRDQETVVSTETHHATVYRDGQPVHTFAVSTGQPGLDTWGGTFAVIDKASDVEMKGANYDVPDVKWAVHFTDTGTYVHSAPWSEGAQGSYNVSHGCVGTNPTDAEWFFDNTLPGDVIKIIGSPRTGALGNGFNDFQLSWQAWQAKSAL